MRKKVEVGVESFPSRLAIDLEDFSVPRKASRSWLNREPENAN